MFEQFHGYNNLIRSDDGKFRVCWYILKKKYRIFPENCLKMLNYIWKIFSENLNWAQQSKIGHISFENIKYKPKQSHLEVNLHWKQKKKAVSFYFFASKRKSKKSVNPFKIVLVYLYEKRFLFRRDYFRLSRMLHRFFSYSIESYVCFSFPLFFLLNFNTKII